MEELRYPLEFVQPQPVVAGPFVPTVSGRARSVARMRCLLARRPAGSSLERRRQPLRKETSSLCYNPVPISPAKQMPLLSPPIGQSLERSRPFCPVGRLRSGFKSRKADRWPSIADVSCFRPRHFCHHERGSGTRRGEAVIGAGPLQLGRRTIPGSYHAMKHYLRGAAGASSWRF
jgi:hypothetical protein